MSACFASAVLSACGLYRYGLARDWTGSARAGLLPRTALFVMLNPSTANAVIDDPTIRRCVGFARAWRCERLEVVNLYALRATNPSDLLAHPDPVGEGNDRTIEHAAKDALVVVAAWGAFAGESEWRRRRVERVLELLPPSVHCLGRTRGGHPRHPLYVRKAAELLPYRTSEVRA